MTLYEAYEDSHTRFDDILFIGGSDYPIEFPVYNSSGAQQDLTSYSGTWFLSPYGQPEIPILELPCDMAGNYSFIITIPKSVTLSLSGAYTHQLEITDSTGKSTRVGEGTIVIKKGIPSLGDSV